MARTVCASVFGIATVDIIHTGQTVWASNTCEATTFVFTMARTVCASIIGIAIVDIIHTSKTIRTRGRGGLLGQMLLQTRYLWWFCRHPLSHRSDLCG
jgi:hypothetical protein